MATQQLTGERRVVTALFCDLVGSTAMAEKMDPEDFSELVAEAVRHMADAVAAYGGTVTQFSGDSILAIYGAPVAHEDDPYRAVRSGLDIIARMAALEVKVRVGINTGLMVISDLEAGAFAGYAALGDAANVAARIQALAPVGGVLIGSETAELVAGDFELEDRGSSEVKGKSQPIHVYEVVGLSGAPTRGRGLSGLTSGLVGRQAELDRLVGLLQAEDARFAVVEGDPGIGKSRLIAELKTHADGSSVPFYVGRCLSFGTSMPQHLVVSVVRALAGVPEAVGDDEAVPRVEAALDELFGSRADWAKPLVMQLLGVRKAFDDTETQYRERQYIDVMVALLERVCAAGAPVVLVCDDVHWADASSVTLLDAVFSRCDDLPLVVVLVTRPDVDTVGWRLVDGLRERRDDLVHVDLQPLTEEDTRQLVSNLLAVESLPETMRRTLLARTDGNPFFVEEVVRMLIDRGLVTHRGGRWVAVESMVEIEVPPTVRGLLASRMDLLPQEVRRAGMLAAVIGRSFSASLFEQVQPGTTHLDDLEERGFLVRDPGPPVEVSFRHALVHDVMYQTLLKRQRRALHQQVGEVIEGRSPDVPSPQSAVLAEHFDRAGDVARARRYLLHAAEHAMGRHAVREAWSFFDRAFARLEGDDPALPRPRVQAALGRFRAGIHFVPADRALADLGAIDDDLEVLADPNLTVQVRMERLRLERDMGRIDRAFKQRVDETLQMMPEVSDPLTLAMMKGLMGQARRFSNDPPSALPFFAEAVEAFEAHGWLSQAAYHALFPADILAIQGRFDEAETLLAQGMSLAQRSGNPNAVLDAQIMAGRLASERGELEEAATHLHGGIQQADQYGNTFCELVANFFAADERLRSGQPEAAIPLLERTHELATYCNAGPIEMLGTVWLSSARAQLGEDVEGQFDGAVEAARAADDKWGEGQVLTHRARSRAVNDPDWAVVGEDYERAVALFGEIGARPYAARALSDWGNLLRGAGHPDAEAVLLRADEALRELGLTAR